MNYSAFRDGVLALVARLSETLRDKKAIGVLTPIVDGQATADDEHYEDVRCGGSDRP